MKALKTNKTIKFNAKKFGCVLGAAALTVSMTLGAVPSNAFAYSNQDNTQNYAYTSQTNGDTSGLFTSNSNSNSNETNAPDYAIILDGQDGPYQKRVIFSENCQEKQKECIENAIKDNQESKECDILADLGNETTEKGGLKHKTIKQMINETLQELSGCKDANLQIKVAEPSESAKEETIHDGVQFYHSWFYGAKGKIYAKFTGKPSQKLHLKLRFHSGDVCEYHTCVTSNYKEKTFTSIYTYFDHVHNKEKQAPDYIFEMDLGVEG